MAVNAPTLQSPSNDEVVKNGAWKTSDLKLEGSVALPSPTYSSCSTSVPFSPAASLGTEMPTPDGARLAAVPPLPTTAERQLSWVEEGYAPASAPTFFDDDDSDDDILPGKPLWSYSGPSLEELLATEKAEREMQINNQEDGDTQSGEEEVGNEEEEGEEDAVASLELNQ